MLKKCMSWTAIPGRTPRRTGVFTPTSEGNASGGLKMLDGIFVRYRAKRASQKAATSIQGLPRVLHVMPRELQRFERWRDSGIWYLSCIAGLA